MYSWGTKKRFHLKQKQNQDLHLKSGIRSHFGEDPTEEAADARLGFCLRPSVKLGHVSPAHVAHQCDVRCGWSEGESMTSWGS